MRPSLAIFLRGVIVLIGVGALALLLWEPHIEGRNVNATIVEIYFNDPFLAYAYIASVPFFLALMKAFVVLGHAERGGLLSQETVKGLQVVKYCALSIIGFVAIGELLIMLSDSDDRAGGVFMGILITLGSIVIATAAMLFDRALRSALNARSAASVRDHVTQSASAAGPHR